MKHAWLGLWMLLPILSACGSGGGASVPPMRSLPTSPQAESQTEPLAALWAAHSSDLLYVSNAGNNSITVYKHDAQGNTAPIRVIKGSNTGLDSPADLSEDAQGNLYVANLTAVLVFAHGASGNSYPIRKIAGPRTGITQVRGLTVDKITGKLFITNDDPTYGLLRFAPNANGNVAALAGGAVASYVSGQIDSESSGKNILYTHSANCCIQPNYLGVQTFPKQFPDRAQLTVIHDIDYLPASSAGDGIADDPLTKTYLISSGTNILRFSEVTDGVGSELGAPTSFTPAMVSAITLSNTSCGELSLGFLRNIYAVCGNAVNVYRHDSSGNVRPLRILSGPATRMNLPTGIYEGK